MDRQSILVVTGLPRSGTSLLMQMLESGGIAPLTDNVRKPDVDNPKGYYEFERVKDLPFDVEWIENARGKVVKVNGPLVTYLPATYQYKIIYVDRNIHEIIQSQNTMIGHRTGKKDENPDAIHDMLEVATMMLNWLKNQRNINLLIVDYNKMVSDPLPAISKIVEFVGDGLDEKKMLEAVDEKLYRNRFNRPRTSSS